MLIHNSAELKAILLPKIKGAIKQTQEQAYLIINRFVKQWYAEYSPVRYERTRQLYLSLVKSEIIELPNGYRAEVYFDLDRLDYYYKRFKGQQGRKNKNWGSSSIEEKVLENEMITGWHDLKKQEHHGTEIWNESQVVLDNMLIDKLVANLKAAGIPIRKT